jgi:hypothetical protein
MEDRLYTDSEQGSYRGRVNDLTRFYARECVRHYGQNCVFSVRLYQQLEDR